MACSKPATSKTFDFEASVVKKNVKVKVYINNESTLHSFPFSLTAAETVGLPLLASDLKSLILSELHKFLPTKEGQKYVLYGRNQTGIESIIADDTPLKSIMTTYILDGSFRIKQTSTFWMKDTTPKKTYPPFACRLVALTSSKDL